MPPSDRDSTLDHDRDSLERRLDAVERALVDDEPLERADRLDDLETRVAELEAAVQALRGYVGSVRAVNEDVERVSFHTETTVVVVVPAGGSGVGDTGGELDERSAGWPPERG